MMQLQTTNHYMPARERRYVGPYVNNSGCFNYTRNYVCRHHANCSKRTKHTEHQNDKKHDDEYKYVKKMTIPRTLDGGIIGKVTIFIDTDGIKKVRKTYEDFKMLESEALSLKQIASYGLNVPEIYKLTENPNEMIMEYIDCEEYPDPRVLANGIKSLHSIKSNMFGNVRNGYTLRLKVTNTQSDNWIEWWIENRWNILANALDEQDKKLMLTIRELIPKIIKDGHSGKEIVPSLIHGDHNDRNMLVQKITGKIYFIDSQCYFGDPYYEFIQYKAQSTNVQNVTNLLDLLYLAFVYGLLHQTLSFRNSYIWRARTCMNKILDMLSPIWPSPHFESNKNSYQYAVVICGTDIFTNTAEQISSTLNKIIQHCTTRHNCNSENILLVLFKTNDWKNMKRQKNKHFIFERMEDPTLEQFVSPNICVDNSNFWSGYEIINRYKLICPNLQKIYVACGNLNINNFGMCFVENQDFILVNNGKYYANRSKNNISIL